MGEVVATVVNGFISGTVATIVWFYLRGRFADISTNFKNVNDELKKIDKELENHKLHVAEEYVTKKEHEKDLQSLKELMKEGFNGIKESIAGLHKRFDRFEDSIRKELDGKEDKKK